MRQIDLEEMMLDRGLKRITQQYEANKKRGEPHRDPGVSKLVKHYLEPMAQRIEEVVGKSKTGKAGRRATIALDFEAFEPITLAYATCVQVFSSLCIGDTATRCALNIGRMLEDHERMTKFYAAEKGAAKWVSREIKRRKINRTHHKRAFYFQVARHKGVDIPKWPEARRLRIGMALVEQFCDATRLAKLVIVHQGGKRYLRFEATPQIMMWIDSHHSDLAEMQPEMLPMIEPPMPRDSFEDGGYHAITRTLVKLPDYTTPHRKLLETADLSQVFSAVQVLDQTPYRVNKRLLNIMQYFWDQRMGIGSLASGETMVPEAMPEDIAGDFTKLTAKQRERRKEWRKYARSVHEQNSKINSRRLQSAMVLRIASQFADYPAIYFPHQLDFRGRVYDMPTGLNPQGPDYARSLLEFAHGKLVDNDEAMRWLQVHGANCYGKDKCSMADRIEWVKENFKEIRKVVRDPKRNTWWMDADKPWSFLAWCFDYMGVLKGEPSRVAVALDGSCNGLQHLSAMLRDPVGAEAVNLKPSPVPQDIYQRVANVVIEDLKKIKKGKEKLWARELLAAKVIDRSLCKRSVMVMPYGGTMTSTLKYVAQSLEDKLTLEGLVTKFGDDKSKVDAFLANIVHTATRKVVKKAAVAMQWLQDVADVAGKAGIHLSWTTPHGFVAHQHYVAYKQNRINFIIDGKRLQSSLPQATKKINTQKSRNSISPNFVHSLDACAMMMTVNKARRLGVDNFRMVHDDYGTHAADTAVLAKCLREAFVEMYQDNDVLAQFLYDVKQQIPMDLHHKLPELPQSGDFDITDVLHSEFFFA